MLLRGRLGGYDDQIVYHKLSHTSVGAHREVHTDFGLLEVNFKKMMQNIRIFKLDRFQL